MKTFRGLAKELAKINPSFKIEKKDDCLRITGSTSNYSDIVLAGKLAAKTHRYYGIINDIVLEGFKDEEPKHTHIEDKALDGTKVDVLVIGGGVIGCAILRELTKYNLSALLVEKEEDVAMGASSRNDGCVHIGIDLKKHSKKLYYLLKSRPIYPTLCAELNVPYREDGQSVGLLSNFSRLYMGPAFKIKAAINHVPGGVKVLSRKKLLEVEPNLASDIKWGVYFPKGACTSPYELTIALAESAIINGAKVSLNTFVTGMKMKDHTIQAVKTNRGTIYPKLVINAAGIYSDKIAEMAEDRFFTIHPRKGTDTIMDKANFSSLSRSAITVLKPGEERKTHSKGGGLIPTIDKNTLVGPDAVEVPNREDYSTNKENIDTIFAKHKKTIEALSERDIITYFSGTRAATYEEDFVVQKGKWTQNIVHAAGIQSPGITDAPGIAMDVGKWASEYLNATANKAFNPLRKGIVRTRFMSPRERDQLIKEDPRYGHIVCRCEEISEGEIVASMHEPLPATTIDGVKRRVRAGMGRCQGGFCQPLVSQLLAQETHQDLLEIKKKGEGKLFFRNSKEDK